MDEPNPSSPAEDPASAPATLVETRKDLEELARRLTRSNVVALDIEANSLHAYHERACVLQLTAGEESAIVDIVALDDLGPLRDALDREDMEIVFHGGDYDVSVLARDHGFRFHRVFDTMIAATLLGDEKLGLADLVREAFGAELDKRFQKADWGKRPLSAEQIDYLHRDTAYLPGLRATYGERLAEADLAEEAAIEFRRLAARCGRTPAFDAEGWRRLKGSNGIDAPARAILARLHTWREKEAERRDVPTFKVLPPRVMVELATRRPSPLRHPGDLRALSPGHRRRYGEAVLKAVRRGIEDAETGRAPAKDIRPRLSSDERAERKRVRKREEALRAWRKEEAATRGVPNLVVLPNRALGWITHALPDTTAALAACEDIGAKRAARYGDAILDVLAKVERGEDATPSDGTGMS